MVLGLEERGGRVNGQLSRRGVEEGPLKLHVLMIPWWFSNDLTSVKRVLWYWG